MVRLGGAAPRQSQAIWEHQLSPQKPSHAGKYRPQPTNHGDPDCRQVQRRCQPLPEFGHCEARKASASDKR